MCQRNSEVDKVVSPAIAGRTFDWPCTNDRACSLDGIVRHRVHIARGLVTAPRLVFMDEPTAGIGVSVQARRVDLWRRLGAIIRAAGEHRHAPACGGTCGHRQVDADEEGAE